MAFQNSVLFPIGNTTHTHTNHKKGRFIKSIFPFKELFFSARCRRERQQTKQKWIPGFLQNLSVCKRGHFDGGAEQLVATCLCVSVIDQQLKKKAASSASITLTIQRLLEGLKRLLTEVGNFFFFHFILYRLSAEETFFIVPHSGSPVSFFFSFFNVMLALACA